MENVDDIGFQEFVQVTPTKWEYKITSRKRKNYRLRYEVLSTGFVQEDFSEGDNVVWTREFRAGERLNLTVFDVIQNGGKIPSNEKAPVVHGKRTNS